MNAGASVSRVLVYDGEGRLVSPFATLNLTEREAAMLWWALYLAYGNEDRAGGLWSNLREAIGEDRLEDVIRSAELMTAARLVRPTKRTGESRVAR